MNRRRRGNSSPTPSPATPPAAPAVPAVVPVTSPVASAPAPASATAPAAPAPATPVAAPVATAASGIRPRPYPGVAMLLIGAAIATTIWWLARPAPTAQVPPELAERVARLERAAATPAPVVVEPTVTIQGFREEVMDGERFLILRVAFSGEGISQWAMEVNDIRETWLSLASSVEEVTFIKPPSSTTFRPVVLLLDGKVIKGEAITWHP